MVHTMSKTMLIVCLAVSFMNGAMGGWETPPPGEHPRIVFNKQDVQELRGRLGQARFNYLFEIIKDHADPIHKGGWGNPPNGNRLANGVKVLEALALNPSDTEAFAGVTASEMSVYSDGYFLYELEPSAFVYAITGEEKYGRIAIRAAMAVSTLLTQDKNGKIMAGTFSFTHGTQTARALALIYDWCYSLCSDAERSCLRKALADLCRRHLDALYHTGYSLGPCPPEIQYAIYWGVLHASHLGIAALAIEGEEGDDPKWESEAKRGVLHSLLRCIDQEGGFHDGPGYVAWGLSYTCYYLEALRLRGERWDKHPNLNALPVWLMYIMYPGSMGVNPYTVQVGCANYGDARAAGRDTYVWLHHALQPNPAMEYVYQWIIARENSGALVSRFLWEEPVREMIAPNSLPRLKVFPMAGTFFRNGWDSESLVFWLCSYQGYSHTGQHSCDYGSFSLYAYGDPLVVEGGGKYGNCSTADNHNLVYIDDKPTSEQNACIIKAPVIYQTDSAFASAAVIDLQEAYSMNMIINPTDTKSLLGIYDYDDGTVAKVPYNVVNKAYRSAVVVWEGEDVPAYALVIDDLEKDGKPHHYRWQMGMEACRQTTIGNNHVRLTRAKGDGEVFDPPALDCYWLSPEQVRLTRNEELKDKGGKVFPRIFAEVDAVNPHYAVLLVPQRRSYLTAKKDPTTTTLKLDHGFAVKIDWRYVSDILLCSRDGEKIAAYGFESDAQLALLRVDSMSKRIGMAILAGKTLHGKGFDFDSKTAASKSESYGR